MLTSKEFTELVFRQVRPSTLDPNFLQEAAYWSVIYDYQGPQEAGPTYVVTLTSLIDRFSYPLFAVTTDEVGYEEELVRATQEFVDRFASLGDLFKLRSYVPNKHSFLDSAATWWSGDDLKSYSPLERLLLTGVDTSALSAAGIKHLFSVQEALCFLPDSFTLPQEMDHYSSLFTMLTTAGWEKGTRSFPHPLLSNVHLVGTLETKTALEEVVALLRSLHRGDEESLTSILYVLLHRTPWHPEQRPEGMSYADLFPPGQLKEKGFRAWLEEASSEEDPYLDLRWLQEHWEKYPQVGVVDPPPVVEEWAAPTTGEVRERFQELLLDFGDLSLGCFVFLETLLPYRGEFTEEERLHLLELFLYQGTEEDEELWEPAVEPSYNRLLSFLGEVLGPPRLARLFLTWPEGEECLSTMKEGEALAAHPEWWDLPPTWWLPLLRAEVLGEALQEEGVKAC